MLFGTILRNRYKIIKKLGSGGFGDTYLAEDMDLPGNPKCVVKHLKTHNPNQKILRIAKRLFNQEAEVLYRLGKLHDQIPQLLAHFEEKGEFYLVQEFVDGYDLTVEISPGKRLSEIEVIQILKEILEVLAVVHEHNVIHRDIKLQNIMRRRDGKIVLIDFGSVKEISLATSAQNTEATSTIVIGTHGYMPNEQAIGKPRFCSDVYAVGMVAIHALTGIPPRDLPIDSSTGEVIWRNLASVSDQLGHVLSNMVRYNFSQRYQTAAEALGALSTSLPLPPTTIRHTYPPKQKQKALLHSSSSDRSRRSQGVQTLGLLMIGVGFGAAVFAGRFFEFSLPGNQETKTTNPTIQRSKNQPTSSPSPKQTNRSKNYITTPTASPSVPSVDSPSEKPAIAPSKPTTKEQTKPSPSPSLVEEETKPSPSPSPVEEETKPFPSPYQPFTPPVEVNPKPSTPAIGEETKPSTPAIEEETKPSTPAIEEDTKPSTPAIGEETKPSTPAIGEETKPSTPAIGEETKPSTPAIGEETKPSPPPAVDNNANPKSSPPPAVNNNPKPSPPANEDGNNKMMIVPSTPVDEQEDGNNKMMIVPTTPAVEESINPQSTAWPTTTPAVEESMNPQSTAWPTNTPTVEEIANPQSAAWPTTTPTDEEKPTVEESMNPQLSAWPITPKDEESKNPQLSAWPSASPEATWPSVAPEQ